MQYRNSKTSALLALSLLPALAVQAHNAQLDTVVVSSANQNALYDVAQPVTVVSKEDLDRSSGASLGAALENLPGVANSSFGAGVGRPVIRGMSGSRVKILQSGSDVADVSAMSSDHSPMSEASAAQQVEILYGPATLVYGGGAIGGVVNLIDKRIHESQADGLSGELSAKSSSVDNGYSTDAALDAGAGNWVLHLDGFKRDAGDYRSGRASDAPLGHNKGRVANSDSEGQGGAVALSWVDDERGFIGASVSTLSYDYGVPNTDGDDFRVKPKQVRYDLKGAWRPDTQGAWGWIDEWRTELSYNDYEHAETEPGVDVGLFEQQSTELQSRIRHQPIGRWQGSVGLSLSQQELALCHSHSGCAGIPSYSASWDGQQGASLYARPSLGGYSYAHDTPMPISKTQQAGLFVVEQRDWAQGTLELGARVDQVEIQADPDSIGLSYRQASSYYDDKRFTPTSLSAAATWVLDDAQRLGLSLARVQRAPQAFELYWNGDHHATFSYQLDNPDLDLETAYTADLSWLYQGARNQLRAALYYYQFDDYIYNDLKGYKDPYHGQDVYRYEQADARFYGAELSWQHDLNAAWHLDLGADFVRAQLIDGGDLPRTPPASMLLAINWENQGWQTRLEAKGVMEQDNVAANEQSSAGFVLLNASASYTQLLSHGQLQWQALASNLTDEYSLNHVSYLKRAAPMAGRNVQLAMHYRF